MNDLIAIIFPYERFGVFLNHLIKFCFKARNQAVSKVTCRPTIVQIFYH